MCLCWLTLRGETWFAAEKDIQTGSGASNTPVISVQLFVSLFLFAQTRMQSQSAYKTTVLQSTKI